MGRTEYNSVGGCQIDTQTSGSGTKAEYEYVRTESQLCSVFTSNNQASNRESGRTDVPLNTTRPVGPLPRLRLPALGLTLSAKQ